MKFPGFIGGSYESQALTADCSRTVNWFPEVLQDKDATAPATLLPTPGVEPLGDGFVPSGRGHIFINGREFVVWNQHFVEIDGAGGQIYRGFFGAFGGISDFPASISSNGDGGNQLFITVDNNGFLFDLGTNTLSWIVALQGKATVGAYLDGYFLCLDSATSTLYLSALMDGATWSTGTDFAQRSLAPDKWVSMAVVGRNVWLYGTQTSEVWYDSGGTFPLTPHPSGLINLGCAAPWSVKVLGADVVWLATSKAGHTCVAKASGFSPSIISTYPMDTAFQSYQNIERAIADSYSSDGHTFYVLNFDDAGATWAWDAATTLWCERGTWVPSLARFTAWRPRFYAHAFGEHRILDSSGGGLYRMGTTYTRDIDGVMIRRLRRAPAIMAENKRVFYKSFEVDLEPGIGYQSIVALPLADVMWQDEQNVTIAGNMITKTTITDDWKAGAFSRQYIYQGGYVEFISPNFAYKKAFGLVTDQRYNIRYDEEFEYGFMIRNGDGRLFTVEDVVQTDTGINTAAGAVLRITVDAITKEVKFYHNGVFISTAVVQIGRAHV